MEIGYKPFLETLDKVIKVTENKLACINSTGEHILVKIQEFIKDGMADL